jgi:hypothetical protein
MRKIILAVVIIGMLLTPRVALAGDVTCPVHDSPCTWTGETKFANAHMFYLYSCLCGDKYWVRQN